MTCCIEAHREASCGDDASRLRHDKGDDSLIDVGGAQQEFELGSRVLCREDRYRCLGWTGVFKVVVDPYEVGKVVDMSM